MSASNSTAGSEESAPSPYQSVGSNPVATGEHSSTFAPDSEHSSTFAPVSAPDSEHSSTSALTNARVFVQFNASNVLKTAQWVNKQFQNVFNENTLRARVAKIKEQRRSAVKNGKLSEWEKEIFPLPQRTQPATPSVAVQTEMGSNSIDLLTTDNRKLKRHLKQSTEREKYYRDKVQKLENEQNVSYQLPNDSSSEDDETDSICTLKEEIIQLRQELKHKEDYIKHATSKPIPTYDSESASYLPEFRALGYSLLEHVSSNHVVPVIEKCFAYVNSKLERLPSASTVRTWNVERLSVAQQHIGDVLPHEKDTTICHNETISALYPEEIADETKDS